jgi:hypothetical protein
MLGLKSFRSAAITLAGVELAHRIRKGQYLLPVERDGRASSLKELPYPVRRVGGSLHTELWVPAEELEEFNRHIVGKIEIVAEFRRAPR